MIDRQHELADQDYAEAGFEPVDTLRFIEHLERQLAVKARPAKGTRTNATVRRFRPAARRSPAVLARGRPLKAATIDDKLIEHASPLDEETARLEAMTTRQRRLIDELRKARLQPVGARRLLKQLQRRLAALRAAVTLGGRARGGSREPAQAAGERRGGRPDRDQAGDRLPPPYRRGRVRW